MYKTELEAREAEASEYDRLYRYKWGGRWHSWVEMRIILRVLRLRPLDCVIDAACGTGRFTLELSKITKGTVIAFDYSGSSVKITKAKTSEYPNTSVVCWNINDPLHLYNPVDKIICIQALHHLADPINAVRLLRSYLKDGGTCIATVYNANCFFLGKLLGRKLQNQGKFPSGVPYKRYTNQEAYQLFSECGFSKVEVYGCVNFDWYRLLEKGSILPNLLFPLAWLDTLVSHLGISRRMGAYLIVKGIR
jgi:SAM-dependent methyltransferase